MVLELVYYAVRKREQEYLNTGPSGEFHRRYEVGITGCQVYAFRYLTETPVEVTH